MNNDLLKDILDEVRELPSESLLDQLIAKTEATLFTQQAVVSTKLIKTAWYLFSVATTRASLDKYPWPKQRLAYQISAHILDLALRNEELDYKDRLSMTFAAQIGYMRGELDPNALAMYKKLDLKVELSFFTGGEIALELGIIFLSQDRRLLFSTLQKLRDEVKEIVGSSDKQESLFDTRHGVDYGVVVGIWELLVFMTYGNRDGANRLDNARRLFEKASSLPSSNGSITSRWVAINLINIIDDLRKNNIWDALPPELPSSIARAMATGTPPLLSLWPPQAQLLRVDPSPLLNSTKNLVISFPTSAGKTLMAQLFVLAHLEQANGGVCFIVPTHSLAREVRKSLANRLRLTDTKVSAFSDVDEWDDEDLGKRVDVMTPEKLSYLLKNNPGRVLDKYSLFIFDEAHLIGDKARGWVMEGVITFLRALTSKREHRIILMSALIGNRLHMFRWLNGNAADMPDGYHSDWRGPRRLYAIFSSEPVWDDEKTITTRSGKVLSEYPLKAHIYLKTGLDQEKTYKFTMKDALGLLSLNAQTKKKEKGTPFYLQSIPFIKVLGESGPVLILETTKMKASKLSLELASTLPEADSTSKELADYIALRLGSEHPLAISARKGVAFHHGALPTDIQTAIEDAVKEGVIRYIVATTTLAEGVNLPVRTVFIAEQGTHMEGGAYEKFISGPKLLNAIGRAGRAGRETDGWIILAVNAKYSPEIFSEFSPVLTEEYDIQSNLSTQEALEALQWYEDNLRNNEDIILEQQAPFMFDQFISYVWFLASSFEDMNYKLDANNLQATLSFSLAWKQLKDDDIERWNKLALHAFNIYAEQPEGYRRRWAKAGTSISSAVQLEEIKDAIVNECPLEGIEPFNVVSVIELLLRNGRLEKILTLKEAPRIKLRPNQSSSVTIEIDAHGLLKDWIRGVDLKELGNKYLSQVTRPEFMFEQLSTYTSMMFEHYLPWILGMVINWANNDLEEVGLGRVIDENIPRYIHYGVSKLPALELLASGLNSRRLAMVISEVYESGLEEAPLISWLRGLPLSEWQEAFNATPIEIRELYECAREDGLIKSVLVDEGGFIEIELEDQKEQVVILEETISGTHTRIAIYSQKNEELGYIPHQYQSEVADLIKIGIPFTAVFKMGGLFITRQELE